MTRSTSAQIVGRQHFNKLTTLHYTDTAANMRDHRKIMADQDIGETAGPLQVSKQAGTRRNPDRLDESVDRILGGGARTRQGSCCTHEWTGKRCWQMPYGNKFEFVTINQRR